VPKYNAKFALSLWLNEGFDGTQKIVHVIFNNFLNKINPNHRNFHRKLKPDRHIASTADWPHTDLQRHTCRYIPVFLSTSINIIHTVSGDLHVVQRSIGYIDTTR